MVGSSLRRLRDNKDLSNADLTPKGRNGQAILLWNSMLTSAAFGEFSILNGCSPGSCPADILGLFASSALASVLAFISEEEINTRHKQDGLRILLTFREVQSSYLVCSEASPGFCMIHSHRPISIYSCIVWEQKLRSIYYMGNICMDYIIYLSLDLYTT